MNIKINNLFFFLLIFFYKISYCQSISDSSYINVKYNTVFLIDTLNINSKKNEETLLLIGKKSSYFKSHFKKKADSIANQVAKKSLENPVNGQVILNTGLLPSAKFTPEVYHNQNKTIIYDKVGKDGYSFELSNTIKWKIENDTKIINGYHCQKAVSNYGKKIIIAWFTSEIPIPEGPYTFKGLPGLILEAYDSKDYFHFNVSSIKKEVKDPIPRTPFSINTTYDKFYEKRKSMMDDPISSFILTFGKRPSKEIEEQIIKNIRKLNNHLD